MNNQNLVPLLAGAAVGAGTMFLLDPGRGARRRALIRDKTVRARHKTTDALDALGRDVANRTRGVMSEAMGAMRTQPAGSAKLIERVRAALGRVVSHPRAIDVTATDDGSVCLSGPILSDEAEDAIAAAGLVRGVRIVQDQLRRHDTAEGVPSLQGASRRPGRRSVLAPRSWTPTTTALAALAGTALVAGLGYAALAPAHAEWEYDM